MYTYFILVLSLTVIDYLVVVFLTMWVSSSHDQNITTQMRSILSQLLDHRKEKLQSLCILSINNLMQESFIVVIRNI